MPSRPLLPFLILCLGAACGGSIEPQAPGEPLSAPATVEQAVSTSVAGTALRYLTLNVGNASPQYGCWEYKMCRPEDGADLRAYILAWQPDILLLTEVYRAAQLTGGANGGPILPDGYTGVCGKSVDRNTGAPAAFDASNASHEHECIAWKKSRLSLVPGSELSAYGRNDSWGKSNCEYDFTGFRVRLLLDGKYTLTAVIAHPDSDNASCRTEEIARYWSTLAQGSRVIIAGDFNTASATELQRRASFADNFAGGKHWNVATHDEYTAFYIFGIKKKLDWAYSNFGAACTHCGPDYGSASLSYGSVCGGYEGMPRADGGDGFDHRQLLVDMVVDGNGGTCAHEPTVTGAALADGCSTCVAAVCAADDWCCTGGWDSLCVSEANQRCTSCSHATSVTGAPLFYGCNACVEKVCDADATCCTNAWSSSCVSRAASLCP
ncbi:MAG: endonuclease/exonuclease/phosphatase family protein [Myxococcaceae bacterium]|nr:endonuclease/exonuclease/phosphatase family protein [Myxococcaceae bacterium]